MCKYAVLDNINTYDNSALNQETTFNDRGYHSIIRLLSMHRFRLSSNYHK